MDRWSWTISIPGVPSMVPAARAFVRAFLDDHPLAADAELITSEYVTNAIRHTSSGEGGVIHLTVAATAQAVRIEVTDRGQPPSPEAETGPAPRPGGAAGEDENGRGLLIVDHLATRWGHFGVFGGPVTAWAELGDPAASETGPAGTGTAQAGPAQAGAGFGEPGGGQARGGATSARRE
jgi:anti-sigma regulatory factor (Ser/Thr protein kinase)